jgi:hypothetical protein
MTVFMIWKWHSSRKLIRASRASAWRKMRHTEIAPFLSFMQKESNATTIFNRPKGGTD